MEPGVVLGGKYRLSRRLGRGGMGEVWVARDEGLGRLVAIKIVLMGLGAGPMLIARLRHEARIVGALQHPGITVVHDIGEYDGHPYFVMELLEGRDFTALPAEYPGGLPVDLAVRLMVQVADALAYAHSRGVVHRDIKPANLMLLNGGGVKICDFGIARYAEASVHLTAPGGVLGTPAFMAPEQYEGHPVDARTDLYAFGATLHTLLTGRPPFQGPSPAQLMRQHLNSPPPHLRELHPELPAELDGLLQRLLAKKPADRPADATQVKNTLQAILVPGDQVSPTTPAFSRRSLMLAGLGAAAVAVAVPVVLELSSHSAASSPRKGSSPARRAAPTPFAGIAQDPDVVLPDNRGPFSVAFSPDGTLLASGNGDGTISVWNVAAAKITSVLTDLAAKNTLGVGAVAFSTDGSILAGGNSDGSVTLWSVATRAKIATLTDPDAIDADSVAFSPEGAILATGSGPGSIALWSVAAHAKIATLVDAVANVHTATKEVNDVVFSPDGSTLVSSTVSGLVEIWNVSTYAKVGTLTGPETGVGSLAFSPDGRTLAGGTAHKAVLLWDVPTRTQVATLAFVDNDNEGVAGLATSVEFSPNGKILVVGTGGGLLQLWDVATRKIAITLGRFTTEGNTDSVNSVAISADGKMLAVSLANKTKLWTLH